MSVSRWRALVCGLVVALAALALPITEPAAGLAPAPTNLTPSFGYLGSGSRTAEITRPASITVSVTLRSGTTPVPNATVELWAKPYSSTWRMLGTAVTNGSGIARRTHSPVHNTTYLWKYLGNEVYAPSPTPEYLTVKVHVKVTMRLEDSTIRAGQRVAARGYVRPAKPGVSATLWRYGPGGSTKLATGVIRSDGSYRITKALSGGSKSLYVTVPATPGNLGGKSPNRSVYVN